jgi:ABC-type dipeptide/oligopeptide/nickel transport system permease subunit
MSRAEKEQIKSPSYYVRKRLVRNKPAMAGLVVVVLAHLIAVLGYLLMPDHTPDADDGSHYIKKQPSGFKVTIIKKRKPTEVEQRFIFMRMLFGQESEYTFDPISEYKIEGWNVKYRRYEDKAWQTIDLVRAVRPVYVGPSDKMTVAGGENYFIKDDQVTYLDIYEKVQTVSRATLLNEFQTTNVDTRRYLLGTDIKGRDMLSRLIFGARISLSIGFIAVMISMIVGVSLGALAGFFGGKVDDLIQWLMTVVWSIPGVMLVIAISLALKSKGIWVAFIAVGLTMWVEVARVVRGQIMGVKEKLYVEAARALGIKNNRIIFQHILPNVMGPIIVIATANFAAAILIEAGLSFLGLGVQPPTPSWGMMVNEGYSSNWESDGGYLLFMPGMCICVLVLAFNLFGNGLRDAYDPQTSIKW